jgi:hypothetical protein
MGKFNVKNGLQVEGLQEGNGSTISIISSGSVNERGIDVSYRSSMTAGQTYANQTTVAAPSAIGTIHGYIVTTDAANMGASSQHNGYSSILNHDGSTSAGFFANTPSGSFGTSKIGLEVDMQGAATNNFGTSISLSGASNNSYGVYVSVTGSNNNEAIRVLRGDVNLNTITGNYKFHVRGDTDSNLLVVNQNGNDNIGVSTSNPLSKFHISAPGDISLFRVDTSIDTIAIGATPITQRKFQVFSGNHDVGVYGLNNSAGISNAYAGFFDSGGTGANGHGVYGRAAGSHTGTNTGVEGVADGNLATTNVGGSFTAANASTNNYAIEIVSGDIKTPTGTGQTGTYTFGGGGSGDVASMTFDKGILVSVTLVP